MMTACFSAARLRSITAALLLLTLLAAPRVLPADQWTDVSGKATMEAELLGVWGTSAVFKKADGSRVSVPLNLLQAESRLRAEKLAQELTQQRAARIAELAQAAKAELAPAPSELPPPPEAPPYEPLPEGADLEQTVQHVDTQVRNGHLRAIWDAMPSKYQTDVDALVVQFAGKMDPQLWQTQMTALRRVVALLDSRQNWILSHPLVAAVAAQTNDAPQQAYRPTLEIVRALLDPQAVSLQRLSQGDLSQWIADRDQRIAGHLQQLQNVLQTATGVPQPTLEVKMIDKTRGTVTWLPPAPAAATPAAAPGQPAPAGQPPRSPAGPKPKSTTFVLVEGRWVPEPIAKAWDAQIKTAQEKIDALPESMEAYRAAVAALTQGVEQFVGPLERAETRDDFHAQMNQLSSLVMAAFMPAMAGGPRPGGAPQQPYGAGQTYGGEPTP